MMHDLQVKFTNEEQAKAFIDAIFNKRNKDDENSTTLAQTLESNIRTVFNSAYKYILELLQNADDAVAREVEFEIKNNHLRVSHTGNHFLPSDIEKICDNAKPSSNKSDDITKTGYKGVGFKATFCISEIITIISLYVRLRFDKSYFENVPNKNPNGKFPWAIIPIWTDKDYSTRLGFERLDENKIHFILQNINTLKVEQEIQEIFSSLEVLLLLRNVSKVKLKHAGIEISKEKNNNYVTLTQSLNGKIQAKKHYLLFNEEIVIPPKIKESLNSLSPSECPEKLKTAEKVKITFAVELDKDNKPIIPKNAKLFSYLPTDIQSGLPFWVNGEFLLKQDRGHLLNNDWNQFLLREIGKRQFRVLKCIAENKEMQRYIISLFLRRKCQMRN
jgi:sacsin